MGSLIRATNLWGYADLVRELGGDPEALLARFQIPLGIENEADAFVPFGPVALLEASAEELGCPDFGLRLSRWQGLDILGPIAVIARNAQTVPDGLRRSRATSTSTPRSWCSRSSRDAPRRPPVHLRDHRADLPHAPQGYELSMANAVGSSAARRPRGAPAVGLVHARSRGRTRPTPRRSAARSASGRTGAGSGYRPRSPAGRSTAPTRRPGGSPRGTWRANFRRTPRRSRSRWRS